MPRHSVLIADDHPLILEGMRTTLAPHCEIVGVVSDGPSLVEAAQRLRPDVIVLDIGLPFLNGIDAARAIRRTWPEAKFVVVTMHSQPSYVKAALEVGATGYVLKSSAGAELAEAVKEVAEGRTWVTPGLKSENARLLAEGSPGPHAVDLTARERQSLQLVAEGRSAKEIAHIMNISVKTVAFHRDNLKHKLGLTSTAELTRCAIDLGLI